MVAPVPSLGDCRCKVLKESIQFIDEVAASSRGHIVRVQLPSHNLLSVEDNGGLLILRAGVGPVILEETRAHFSAFRLTKRRFAKTGCDNLSGHVLSAGYLVRLGCGAKPGIRWVLRDAGSCASLWRPICRFKSSDGVRRFGWGCMMYR